MFETACQACPPGLFIPFLAAVFHVRDQAGHKLQDPLLMSYIQQVRYFKVLVMQSAMDIHPSPRVLAASSSDQRCRLYAGQCHFVGLET